ncbi:hypothetical protein GCM10023200_27480 [Actinomycetospora chlora]|uniref:Uncharacterized protein n=1 Tax=Actinomycetospora chlora TaxID=663608 RepID=A0ABP9B923_9PSEU
MTLQLSRAPFPDVPETTIVVQAVERLASEFPTCHRTLVTTTVAQCRRDLDGSPPGAMPELLERLAPQRLRQEC